MRIIIIGGTGHVGSFLVPRLIDAGHEVTVVSRKEREPYLLHPAWRGVKQVQLDRNAPTQKGSFGKSIAEMNPEVVIDMICFDKNTAMEMTEALRGVVRQYLFCGTIWVYGRSVMIPTGEDRAREPLTEYGRLKAEAEAYFLREYHETGFPVSILHPGHIVGPGWRPVNPAGNLNLEVFRKLAKGEEVALPNLGMETLHHVHADDIAQAFVSAMDHPEAANGESFNIVSAQAMSMRGYAELMGAWWGKPAVLKFLPWEQWKQTVGEEDAGITWDHLIHSPCCSIEKAGRLLQYRPRYSAIEAVQESIGWQRINGGL
ncbi:MAG: NAD-dependent epimerase/dehydratase family protein [Chitinophagaceae bacterium]|nr:NAD-dependent epimerase/dehydratase family protein [Chitinophagaceae bacterium]